MIGSIARTVVACLAEVMLARASLAQSLPDEAKRLLEAGEAALTEGRHDDAIAAFEARRALDVDGPLTPWYLARACYAKGDDERGFAWVMKAVEAGLGAWPTVPAHVTDPDELAPLRDDPRYPAIYRQVHGTWLNDADFKKPAAVSIDWANAHTNEVLDARFSPDQTRIVSASQDGTARVWDVATGEPLLLLRGHTHFVCTASFSPDQQTIATSSTDYTIRTWDASSGRTEIVFEGHTDSVTGVAFSPSGRWIASSGLDKTARIWETGTGKSTAILRHPRSVSAVRFTVDGQRLITVGADGIVRIWDPTAAVVVHALESRAGEYIGDIALSPDGRCAIVLGNGAGMWNLRNGEFHRLAPVYAARVSAAAFSPDSSRFVTANDGIVRTWDSTSLQQLHQFRSGHPAGIMSIDFSPDGQYLLTASLDHSVRIWEASSGTQLKEFSTSYRRTRDVAFNDAGTRLVTIDAHLCDRNGPLRAAEAREWDTATGRPVPPLGRAPQVEFPHQAPIATEARSYRWSGKDAKPLSVSAKPGPLTDLYVSPDHRFVYMVDRNGVCMLWDAQSSLRHDMLKHSPWSSSFDYFRAAGFSPDGKRFAIGSYPDGNARVWNLERPQEPPLILGGAGGMIWSAAFDSAGDRIVTTAGYSSTRLFDAHSGKMLARCDWHGADPSVAAFSPDGRLIAIGDVHGIIHLWDGEGRAELHAFLGHSWQVDNLAFSKDGALFASASRDGTVKLWDVKQRRLLLTIARCAGEDWLSFTPDLYFDGSQAAVEQASLLFGGVAYPLQHFSRSLQRPDLLEATLAGRFVPPPVIIPPPSLVVTSPAEHQTVSHQRTFKLQARALSAPVGVSRFLVWQDGAQLAAESVSNATTDLGTRKILSLDLLAKIPDGQGETVFTLQAESENGTLSRKQSVTVRYQLPEREIYLVAMGVEDYDDDRLDLKYPLRDVDAVIERFKLEQGQYYREVHVERLANREVTPGAMRRVLDRFLTRARAQDTIVVFAAGHGVRINEMDYYLLTSGTTPDDPYEAIDRRTLEDLVASKKLSAERRLLFIDTCHGGSKIGESRGAKRLYSQDTIDRLHSDSRGGLYIMAASSEDQFAREIAGNGIFTRALLDGLSGMADGITAKELKNDLIEVEELKSFVEREVHRRSDGQQWPTCPRVEAGENFPIARARPEKRQ